MDEYIKREALREAFDNADADIVEEYGDGDCDWGFGRKNVLEVINSVPAADVAPVRNGLWVKRGCKWQCTNCKVLMSIDGTPKENLLNYCPNCGAKMDEEGISVGICEHCAYREDCEWPKIHPKIKLKDCPDFNKGDKK